MSLEITVYNQQAEKVGAQKVAEEVFALEPKESLIHQVIVAYLANRRLPWAHTKDRSEVRGGGKKPWKQKGTGRARHGSIRSPLWIGGGITFGPRKERNYQVKVNVKMKQKALKMVLSDRAQEKKLLLLDKWSLKEQKTKEMAKIFQAFYQKVINASTAKKPKILLVLNEEEKDLSRISRNLPYIELVGSKNLNAFSVLQCPYLFCSQATLQEIEKRYK